MQRKIIAEENCSVIAAANDRGNCTQPFFTAAFRDLYVAASAFAKPLHGSLNLAEERLNLGLICQSSARNNL